MYLIKTIALMFFLATSVSALAAASGSSPKGKPFVEINGQIVEVQGQLVTLEQRMDNVIARMAGYETRLSGLEAGIASLQAEGQALEQKLLDLESGLTTVEEIVAELEAKDLELQAELDAYGDTNGQLALDIDANLMLIESLTASLDDGVSGLQLLIGQIYEALEELRSVQGSLVGQMKLKQQILHGTCDEGFDFKGFQDGVHVCQQSPSTNGPIEVLTLIASQELAFGPNVWEPRLVTKNSAGQWAYGPSYGQFAGVFRVGCPTNSSIVGGGISSYPEYFLKLDYSKAFTPFGFSRQWVGWGAKVSMNSNFSVRVGYSKAWNPLFLPYVLNAGKSCYLSSCPEPEDTIVVSVFAACAVVASDYTFE